MQNNVETFNLEIHPTKDTSDNHINGSLTVIWRDWDKKFSLIPKMIYTTKVLFREKKGPHLHKKRDSFFVCIKGRVAFIIKDPSGNYHEIISSEENPILVHVPKNFASGHINLAKHDSTVLTITNLAWKPNDNEMINVTFDDYDWKKWKDNAQPE